VSIPLETTPVPPRVRDLARGASCQAVWRNDLGGMTFRTDDGRFIKHAPRNAESSLVDEAERLEWAGRLTPVPHVLEAGGDDTHEWLVTRAIAGESAVAPRWIAEPETAVRAVGEGLRALHDALPVAECPFDWGVASRVANAAGRGIRLPDRLHEPPPTDLLVVCHADACCPNTLIDDQGSWVAHVDLGLLGTADRWADIAVAAMSTGWNYGPGWDDALMDAYGIEPDPERLAFYRDLWNAT
jgi:kanamycin kinase